MTRRFHYLALAALLLLSAALCGWRLGHTPLWDDEAHVSIVARNLLERGELSGWDGRNLIGYRNGAFLDAHLRTRNAPLDCLLVAASFRVLGVSTVAARLPFVVCGLLSLVAFALLLRGEFRARGVVLYALALFGLGVVFVLNARTARYNALAFTLPLCAFVCYRRWLQTKSFGWLLGCAVAFVGLFYASYLFALAFGMALFAVALMCHRDNFNRRDWPAILVACALFFALTLPYIVAFRAWDYPRSARDALPRHVFTLLRWNLRDLPGVAPNVWIFAALGAVLWRAKPGGETLIARRAREWTLLCVVYLAVLCVFSPQPVSITDVADTRYLLPLAPFLAGLCGLVLWRAHRVCPPLGLVCLALALCINLPLPRSAMPQLLLPAYLRENARPYPVSTDLVLRYLRAHPLRDQTLACTPPHLSLPLVFYAPREVIIAPQLARDTLLSRAALRDVRPSPFFESTFPARFIAFGWNGAAAREKAFFARPHRAAGRMARFVYRLEATLPVFWNQTQRPELVWHTFGPVTGFAARDQVFLFRRETALARTLQRASQPRCPRSPLKSRTTRRPRPSALIFIRRAGLKSLP